MDAKENNVVQLPLSDEAKARINYLFEIGYLQFDLGTGKMSVNEEFGR